MALLVTTYLTEIVAAAGASAHRAARKREGWEVTDRSDRLDGTTALGFVRQDAIDTSGLALARTLADDAGESARLVHAVLDAAAKGTVEPALYRKLLRAVDARRDESGPAYRALQAALNAVQSVTASSAAGRAGALACVRNAVTLAQKGTSA